MMKLLFPPVPRHRDWDRLPMHEKAMWGLLGVLQIFAISTALMTILFA